MENASARMDLGQAAVWRSLRRTLHEGPGGVMFNRLPIHKNSDTPKPLAA